MLDIQNKGVAPLTKAERIELDELREQHKKVIEKAKLKAGLNDGKNNDHSSDDSEEEYLDEANDLLNPVT